MWCVCARKKERRRPHPFLASGGPHNSFVWFAFLGCREGRRVRRELQQSVEHEKKAMRAAALLDVEMARKRLADDEEKWCEQWDIPFMTGMLTESGYKSGYAEPRST